ncbi:hypothetical protein M8J77_004058 [Diaphorina citri]|nr:hypothetical protein M8J77_004058 [Diaphorina citri]
MNAPVPNGALNATFGVVGVRRQGRTQDFVEGGGERVKTVMYRGRNVPNFRSLAYSKGENLSSGPLAPILNTVTIWALACRRLFPAARPLLSWNIDNISATDNGATAVKNHDACASGTSGNSNFREPRDTNQFPDNYSPQLSYVVPDNAQVRCQGSHRWDSRTVQTSQIEIRGVFHESLKDFCVDNTQSYCLKSPRRLQEACSLNCRRFSSAA